MMGLIGMGNNPMVGATALCSVACYEAVNGQSRFLKLNVFYNSLKFKFSVKYFSVASGGGTGRTLHPDNMAAGPLHMV